MTGTAEMENNSESDCTRELTREDAIVELRALLEVLKVSLRSDIKQWKVL